MIDANYKEGQHADYYGGNDNPYECIKVINAWAEQNNWDAKDGFYLGTVLRYICRNGNKKGNDKEQDLQKCVNYLQMYIKQLQEDKSTSEILAYTE